MSAWIDIELRERLRKRLVRLYGEEAAGRGLERLLSMFGRYGVGMSRVRTREEPWSERTAMLIVYGDSIHEPDQPPLSTLKRFAEEFLTEAFSAIHVLPFYPYSSDDGFSVIDYRDVEPTLGTWEDIQRLSERVDVMFDLVLNHVSRKSAWFRSYYDGDAPYRDYFIETDAQADLSAVVRPRSLPLLTEVAKNGQRVHLWTTFSSDQIDLNFSNPDVLFEFLDILFGYIAHGATIIRLDAIAYLWKRIGTPCIHLPETHEVVKLFRDVVDRVAPGVLLLTETNVPHEENVSYFGAGDEAHMVYQFSLPPLLLHALQVGDGRYLIEWLRQLSPPPTGCAYLNFTASHDGIGVRPLQGLLPTSEMEALIARIRARGGQVSTRRMADGRDVPYELNTTFFDTLAEGTDEALDTARFICSQTVPLSLQGVPAVYIQSLFGAQNDEAGFKLTGRARSLNRKKWVRAELDSLFSQPGSREQRIFHALRRLLKIRARCPAFHPDAKQDVLDLGSQCLALRRTAADGSTLVALHNLTAQPIRVNLPELAHARKDLLSPRSRHFDELAPYQCRWLI